jgi:hypothetical protein
MLSGGFFLQEMLVLYSMGLFIKYAFFASLGVILTTVLCMLAIPALYFLVQVSYEIFHL